MFLDERKNHVKMHHVTWVTTSPRLKLDKYKAWTITSLLLLNDHKKTDEANFKVEFNSIQMLPL